MSLIRMSPLSGMGPTWESPHDYAGAGAAAQGGTRGIVFNRTDGTSYRTAFVECSTPGSFIRGEGTTLEEADDACWAKLQAYLGCPAHEWEPGRYRNGGGVCRLCGQFGSKVFTPEDLGLSCRDCGKPTFHTATGVPGPITVCLEHDERWPYVHAALAVMFSSNGEDNLEEMWQRLDAVQRGGPLDPDALEWAREHGYLDDLDQEG